MREELGADWRERFFATFDEKPMAAASIGQVHRATLLRTAGDESRDGAPVAVKIQYPGVAHSIDSDLKIVERLLAFSNILPRGLFMDNTIRVARKELAWEVDYVRESRMNEVVCDKLAAMPVGVPLSTSVKGVVPAVIAPKPFKDLCTKRVLVSEYVDGIPLSCLVPPGSDKGTDSRQRFIDVGQNERNRVVQILLELCFTELFGWLVMQTDPNWTNFLYLPETRQVWR